MTKYGIISEYFDWLYELVCENRFSKKISYRKLLSRLHDTEFIFSIPLDRNRAKDGINLRYRFALSHGYGREIDDILDDPCSVLEMMVAIALRMEEEYMDDPCFGNRTGQWFWNMMVNLGLGGMTDYIFDRDTVDDIIDRFLHREYSSDGRGGLFRVRYSNRDMRNIEIWHQMCEYLDEIADI